MITTKTTSNIDAVLAQARAALSGGGPSEHVLEVRNTAEYAVYLEAREAYWVVSDEVLRHCANEAVAKRLTERNRAGALLTDSDVVEALHEAADETVEFYQSTIGTTDEPGRVKLPPRPTHPGAFSDDTEKLASSYESRVSRSGIGNGEPWKSYEY